MNYYRIGEEKFEIELKKGDIFVNGREAARGVVFEQSAGKGLLVKIGDSVLPVFIHRENDVFYCWVDGETYRICEIDPAAGQGVSAHPDDAGEKVIIAPMPGKVVKVLVKAGDEVKRGERMLIIESMKMETEIIAPGDGRIKTLKYVEGDVFREEEVLVEIE